MASTSAMGVLLGGFTHFSSKSGAGRPRVYTRDPPVSGNVQLDYAAPRRAHEIYDHYKKVPTDSEVSCTAFCNRDRIRRRLLPKMGQLIRHGLAVILSALMIMVPMGQQAFARDPLPQETAQLVPTRPSQWPCRPGLCLQINPCLRANR